MSRIVIYRENSSSHEEEYLSRPGGVFVAVKRLTDSNLDFESRAEAYEFASEFPRLQHWRVGVR